MRFAKGHGTENDFVILPDPSGTIDLTPALTARLCDRRAGLGADGVLRVAAADPGAGAQWFMDYRNADGSIAEMCGNGVRVFARYLLDHDLAQGPEFAVATRAGTRWLSVAADGDVTVDMGPPQVLGASHATLAGRPLAGLAVSLGNPHLACVTTEPLDSFDLSRRPAFDAAAFPAGANLELVRFTGEHHIQMVVHERGSGPTRSCGTGAVAAAVAAALHESPAALLDGPERHPTAGPPAGTWTVDVPGGRLRVIFDGWTSFLAGPAVIVAEGELTESWLAAGQSPAVQRMAVQSSPAA
ncbi:MAG TPA: diaminopimelate epimerase [Streptosporangiaceae bacterium]|jgi:diaminopimelate epimerase